MRRILTAAFIAAFLFAVALLLLPVSEGGSGGDLEICKRGIRQAYRLLEDCDGAACKARKVLENTAYAAGFDIEGD